MKIEMGESLFYSWLRHVKECQIVQTNWKVSSKWEFYNNNEIEDMFQKLNSYFDENYCGKVFKKSTSLNQVIQQGECDALGLHIENGNPKYYAVDVAFHENGLNYGTKEETVLKILAKSIRTIFCLYGYFHTKSAEIIFASPKIHNSILEDTIPFIKYINDFFQQRGFDFNIKLIYNEDFFTTVLEPILLVSDSVADTSELFMRAYQMFAMFVKNKNHPAPSNKIHSASIKPTVSTNTDKYKELKIGQIARTVFKDILESGVISDEEISAMQTSEYSRSTFHLGFPLLVSEGADYDKARYYQNRANINGKHYYICSQWFETPSNNDRPYLINWIESHIQNQKINDPPIKQPISNPEWIKKVQIEKEWIEDYEDYLKDIPKLPNAPIPQIDLVKLHELYENKTNLLNQFKNIFQKQGLAYNTCNTYASSLYSVCEREYIPNKTELEEKIEQLRIDYGIYGKYSSFGSKNSGAVRASINAFYSYCKWKELDKWRDYK